MTAEQLALGLDDRHAGQAANLAAAHTGHRNHRLRVDQAITELAAAGEPFTADTVHNRLGTELPYDRNLVSSLIGVWAQRHRIIEHPRPPVPSTHRSRHHSRNRWWIGADNIPEARRG
jgi:hypothetical protein